MKPLVALVLAVALTTAGCISQARSISPEFQPSAEAPTVVIGRIEMLQRDGRPLSEARMLKRHMTGRLTLLVEHEQTGRKFNVTGADSGAMTDFYVSIPPGRYRVSQVWIRDLETIVRASFDVPPAPVVYVGTLRFVGDEVTSWGFTRARGRWSVEDTGDTVARRFRERHPRLTSPVIPSLMRPPGEPPSRDARR